MSAPNPNQGKSNARRVVLVNEDGSQFKESPGRIALGSAVRHDTNPLPFTGRAISFSAVGDVKVVTSGGDTVVIPSGSLAAGMQHAMEITQLWDTGTTAANIVVYG